MAPIYKPFQDFTPFVKKSISLILVRRIPLDFFCKMYDIKKRESLASKEYFLKRHLKHTAANAIQYEYNR